MNTLAEKYLRTDLLPTLFCPGCGNGILVHAFLEVMEDLGIQDDLAYIAGVGCCSWLPFYIKADFMKTLHGRAIPAAIGLKASRPSRKVVVVTGDGDCLGIGGNHLLHAARRNIDLTVVMVNNQIYAMTGGQAAPSTPLHAKTQTSPYGNAEQPLDGCKVAMAAGATFVARWSTSHYPQLVQCLKKGFNHKGFSYIEVISQCPTQMGRYSLGSGVPSVNFDWIRDDYCSKVSSTSEMEQVLRENKVPLGEFLCEERPEFIEMMQQIIQQVQNDATETN